MAKLSQKINLMNGLLTCETAIGGPSYVSIDVTQRCNLQCLCCIYHSPLVGVSPREVRSPDISPDLFQEVCRELKTMGTNLIIIEGEGEPLLHSRIFDLISIAKRMGFQVMLFTNGILLDETRVLQIIDLKVNILKVSLWASSPEEYAQNYPESDIRNFEKVVNGLKLLSYYKIEKKAAFPYVELCNPINRYNFQKIEKMVDFLYTTGCNSIFFSSVNSHKGKFASFALSPDEERLFKLSLKGIKKKLDAVSIKHNIDQVLLRYKIGEAVWEKLPCYIAWYHSRIKVDGTVLPCNRCNLPMGNLKQDTFHHIWNAPNYRVFRRKAMTRNGLTLLSEHCNCGYCCHVVNNKRIHKVFRWLSPLSGLARKRKNDREENDESPLL